ncbi:hypothetical protein DDJ48_01595 [Mycobacteroides abscessus]|nr:hypothetical protein DDJ48_01595 [Mycobacteroides abscessus]RIT93262.1 hypothetical protein D2F00_20850 [Mycobacteroides abscessus]
MTSRDPFHLKNLPGTSLQRPNLNDQLAHGRAMPPLFRSGRELRSPEPVEIYATLLESDRKQRSGTLSSS